MALPTGKVPTFDRPGAVPASRAYPVGAPPDPGAVHDSVTVDPLTVAAKFEGAPGAPWAAAVPASPASISAPTPIVRPTHPARIQPPCRGLMSRALLLLHPARPSCDTIVCSDAVDFSRSNSQPDARVRRKPHLANPATPATRPAAVGADAHLPGAPGLDHGGPGWCAGRLHDAGPRGWAGADRGRVHAAIRRHVSDWNDAGDVHGDRCGQPHGIVHLPGVDHAAADADPHAVPRLRRQHHRRRGHRADDCPRDPDCPISGSSWCPPPRIPRSCRACSPAGIRRRPWP